ncbi:MAG: hypothetical protein KAS07_04890 [Candidatus Pacebacteria bacterium]|nr:hypothetical protein [Candidatus Paceibacterota bacterium]
MPGENMTKMCTKCGKAKKTNSFGICRSNKDGRLYNCKKCVKEYRLKSIKIIKLYTFNNKDKKKEYDKKYKIKNNEKMKESRRLAYPKHKTKRNNYNKDWRKKNPGKAAEYRKLHIERFGEDNVKRKMKEWRDKNIDIIHAKGFFQRANVDLTLVPHKLLELKETQLKLKRALKSSPA